MSNRSEKRLIKVVTRISIIETYEDVVFDTPGGRVETHDIEINGIMKSSKLKYRVEDGRIIVGPNMGVKSFKVVD